MSEVWIVSTYEKYEYREPSYIQSLWTTEASADAEATKIQARLVADEEDGSTGVSVCSREVQS